jgi:hypothetical protein
MSKTNLTYYGPAPVNSNGVLNAFVQQPTTESPSETTSGIVYSEVWKGPYEKGKNILSFVKIGDTRNVFYTWLGANRVYRIDPPNAPIRNGEQLNWYVDSINVSELQAGDHCTITVKFKTEFDNAESPNIVQEVPDSLRWDVAWQSYTVTPYEFASGKVHEDISMSPSYSGDLDYTVKASRIMIEKYRNNNGRVVTLNEGTDDEIFGLIYSLEDSFADTYVLGGAETELYKKISLNRNAVYHYPVITKTRTYQGMLSADLPDELGVDMDTISSLPEGCPYTFAKVKVGDNEKDRVWLKMTDNLQIQQIDIDRNVKTLTRTEQWAGYDEVDENYYGTGNFTHTKDGILSGRWYKGCL